MLPENSIPAFLSAIDAGADAIELDIHASGDGVLFVHHDPQPVTTDGDESALSFAQMTSDDVSALRLPGELRIPTLDDVIESVDGRAGIFVEVKARGIEDATARCLKRHLGRVDQIAVHSFDHRIVRRMKGLFPSVRTGVLQASYLVDTCAAMRLAGATDLWQQIEFVDEVLVADVHACGGRVIVWTANSEREWDYLESIGVDGVCTDRPDLYVLRRATP
jgi:glycerophosphoryl diester phosphodiesterase